MRSLIAFMALALVTVNAQAAAKFPSWEKFKTYTPAQMRTLPDVKASPKKLLNEASVKKMSAVQVVLLKNSIYAQHGFEFSTPYLKNYFASRNWYRPGGYSLSSLNKTEKANARFLKHYVAKLKLDPKMPNNPGHGDDGYGYGYGEEGYNAESGAEGYGEEGYGYGENYGESY